MPGTYVYCLVGAARRPSLARMPRGLPGMGRVRLLEAGGVRRLTQWLVVADAPLDRYGADAINRHLSDLDWVSRAAVAHEAVIETFIRAPAVLPMKLFTIFTSDARALEHVRSEASRIHSLVRRVAHHHEWGVRIVLDRPAASGRRALAAARTAESGRVFLSRKKAQRDEAAELARHARDAVAAVYDRLARLSAHARRRAASELPLRGGPLLLDAAFLVASARSGPFRRAVAREARAIAPNGYRVTLTGPWPPYSFIRE